MKLKSLLLSILLFFWLSPISYATTVFHNVNDLGGGIWEYDYTVANDTLTSDIEEFTIYFEYGFYDNLRVTTPLAVSWDELTVNPDLIFGFPEDGFYDALSLVSGIAPGNTKSGFSVTFDWLGSGTPVSQYFEVVSSTTFDVIDSGNTSRVPEPSALLILGTGIAGLVGLSRRLKRKSLQ